MKLSIFIKKDQIRTEQFLEVIQKHHTQKSLLSLQMLCLVSGAVSQRAKKVDSLTPIIVSDVRGISCLKLF